MLGTHCDVKPAKRQGSARKLSDLLDHIDPWEGFGFHCMSTPAEIGILPLNWEVRDLTAPSAERKKVMNALYKVGDTVGLVLAALHLIYEGSDTGLAIAQDWIARAEHKDGVGPAVNLLWHAISPPTPDFESPLEILVDLAKRSSRRQASKEESWNDRDFLRRVGVLPTSLEFPSDISIENLIARQDAALVEGLLQAGDQAMLYAPSGAGKSFVALDLCWHIALGKSWHGREVKRSPVLYVALEGVAGFQKRVLAAKQVHGDPGKMFSRLVPHVSLNKAQAGAEGLSTVLKACEELSGSAEEPVRLIVIDTQVRATAGDDENASADMMLYLEKRAGEIARKTGAAVLTLHHPNKGGDLRGSTAIPAGLDVILQIKGRSLVVEKNKDDIEGPMFDFELEPVTLACDARGRAITSCVVRASPPAASIPARPAKRSVDETRLIGIFLGHPGKRQVPVADVRAAYVRRRVDSEGAKLASANRAWRSLLARLPQYFSIEQDHSGTELMLWHAEPD